MKIILSAFAVAVALAFAAPAFAGPDNQADCEAAGGTWDSSANACTGTE